MPAKRSQKIKSVPDLEIITTIVRCAELKKADHPVILDLRHIDGPASYFIICSGQSSPQLRAITDSVTEGCRETHHLKPIARDGSRESGWIILDYGSILVHILSHEQRIRYSLEDLWHDATPVKL